LQTKRYDTFVENSKQMKIITRFLTLLLLSMAFLSYGQQTQTVCGIIIDEASKAPITGVSILLIQSGAKKPIATSTNTEVEFMLNTLPNKQTNLAHHLHWLRANYDAKYHRYCGQRSSTKN